MFVKRYWLYSLILLTAGACSPSQNLPSISDFELEFYQSKDDPDREEILSLSDELYAGSGPCSLDSGCLSACADIYSLKENQKNCRALKTQQVYQIQKLYHSFLDKNLSELEDVNVFDLKVFFNVSAQPLFQFFKSLDHVFSKLFFNWIALNWQVAKVFSEEDNHALFLRIFLNKLADLPINSLKEQISENRTFIELAWLKQNDFALLWLNNYFKKEPCGDLKKEELDNCMLAQYCLVGDSFKPDVSKEIMDFRLFRGIIKEVNNHKDFNSFCYDFCFSGNGQTYCE